MKKFWFVAVFNLCFLCLTTFISSGLSAEEIEGTLEVLMATEMRSGKCEPLYFIKSEEKRTQFSPPADAPSLAPGQRIKISGQWDADDGKSFRCGKVELSATPAKKKRVSTEDTDISIYLPEQSPVIGPQKTLVVLVSFSDHGLPGWGKAEMDNKVFRSAPTNEYPNDHSDNAFWKGCSEEKMWLTGECLDGWKKMLNPSSEYGYGTDEEINRISALMYDVINMLDQHIDFREWEGGRIVFMRTGKGWRYAFGTLGQWPFSTNEGQINLALAIVSEICLPLKTLYISHELGHGLGLLHADGRRVSTGEFKGYGDDHSAMGGSGLALVDNLAKYRLGWLDTSQIKLISADGEYWLDQRELTSAGIKLLVIFLGYDGDKNPLLYSLEYFRELGEFDSQVFSSFEVEEKRKVVLMRKHERDLSRFSDSLVYLDDNDIPVLGLMQEYCDSDYANAQYEYERYGVCFKVTEKTGEGPNSQAKVGIRFTKVVGEVSEIKLTFADIKRGKLFLLKGKIATVTAKVLDKEGAPVPGIAIGTGISNTKVSISPSGALSNEEGSAEFTVTAGNTRGGAKISFTSQEVKKILRVKVK